MKLFIFVGHSGAGKTTLIEKLLPELTRRGLSVGTLKHAHHTVQLDTPGKDSWRYKQAGAARSLLVTTHALQLVADTPAEHDPATLAAEFMGQMDVVLAEGFSFAPGPKIEILRQACAKPPRCTLQQNLVAMVTDSPETYPELPHFELEDVAGIVDFMLGYPE